MKYLSILENNQEAIAWIDQEVARLLAELLELKGLRNDRVAACRIPDEVIAEIVKISQYDDPKYEWIKTSHICSRWRRVVLGTALLWTSIQANNLGRAAVFLRRSGTAPVSISISRRLSDEGQETFAQLLRSHSHHVKSLALSLPSTDMVTVVGSLNLNMPRLQCIYLKDPRGQSFYASYATELIKFQPSFRSYPPLHTLVLESVALSWDLSMFRELRVLEISRVRTRSTEAAASPRWLKISQLLDILDICPSLERLKINTTGPLYHRIDPLTPIERTVSLPNLQELELTNSPSVLALFLSHLIIPATTRSTFKAQIFDDPGSFHGPVYISPFPRSCATTLGCAALVEKLTLDLKWSRTLVVVKGETSPSFTSGTPQEDNSMVITEYEWIPSEFEDGFDFVPGIMEGMGIDIGRAFGSNVRELVIRGDTFPVVSVGWRNLFGFLHQLNSLSIYDFFNEDDCGDGMETLVRTLETTEGSDTKVVCPLLKEIHLWNIKARDGTLASILKSLRTRVAWVGKLDLMGIWDFVYTSDDESGRELGWNEVAMEVILRPKEVAE